MSTTTANASNPAIKLPLSQRKKCSPLNVNQEEPLHCDSLFSPGISTPGHQLHVLQQVCNIDQILTVVTLLPNHVCNASMPASYGVDNPAQILCCSAIQWLRFSSE